MRFNLPACLCLVLKTYKYSSFFHLATIRFVVKMEKRCRPPQGYYKSLETAAIFRGRILCNRKPDVLGVYQAEWIVAKKIHNRKPVFMVQWQGYCPSENMWEPKDHLPPELIEAFENPAPDPVREEEAQRGSVSCLKGE